MAAAIRRYRYDEPSQSDDVQNAARLASRIKADGEEAQPFSIGSFWP